MGSMLRGDGYFNAHHLYEGIAEKLAGTDELFAFDWETFCANPADVHIDAFDPATGETVRWSKADMPIAARHDAACPRKLDHAAVHAASDH